MHNEDQVHMVMGREEAKLIGTALGVMLSHVDHDISRWKDKGEQSQNEFMSMLSVKFAATNMFSSIWTLLGIPVDAVEDLLAALGEEE